MGWKDLASRPIYKNASPEDKMKIRERYFEDFVATRPDYPQDEEAAMKLKNRFITGRFEGEPTVEPFAKTFGKEVAKSTMEAVDKVMEKSEDIFDKSLYNALTSSNIATGKGTSEGVEAINIAAMRPFKGAVRALVAGRDVVKGFKDPDFEPDFYTTFRQKFGVDESDPINNEATKILADMTEDLAASVPLILLGVGLHKGAQKVTGAYTGMQKAGLTRLHRAIANELIGSGKVDVRTAHQYARQIIANKWSSSNAFTRNPVVIDKAAKNMEANKGFWSDKIKGMFDAAQQNRNAGNDPVYKSWVRKSARDAGVDLKQLGGTLKQLPDTVLKLLPIDDSIAYDNLLKNRAGLNRLMPGYDIPLHPPKDARAALLDAGFVDEAIEQGELDNLVKWLEDRDAFNRKHGFDDLERYDKYMQNREGLNRPMPEYDIPLHPAKDAKFEIEQQETQKTENKLVLGRVVEDKGEMLLDFSKGLTTDEIKVLSLFPKPIKDQASAEEFCNLFAKSVGIDTPITVLYTENPNSTMSTASITYAYRPDGSVLPALVDTRTGKNIVQGNKEPDAEYLARLRMLKALGQAVRGNSIVVTLNKATNEYIGVSRLGYTRKNKQGEVFYSVRPDIEKVFDTDGTEIVDWKKLSDKELETKDIRWKSLSDIRLKNLKERGYKPQTASKWDAKIALAHEIMHLVLNKANAGKAVSHPKGYEETVNKVVRAKLFPKARVPKGTSRSDVLAAYEEQKKNFEKMRTLEDFRRTELVDILERKQRKNVYSDKDDEVSMTEKAFTSIGGKLEELKNLYLGKGLKVFAQPFWIAEKYPQFKPMIEAVINGKELKDTKFLDLMDILDYHKLRKLEPLSKLKVAKVLDEGDKVRTTFTDKDLVEKYKLSDIEIDAYKKFRQMYDQAFVNKVQTMMEEFRYEEMTPEEKARFNDAVKKNAGYINGYVNRQRGDGNFVVYLENEAGNPSFFNIYKDKGEALQTAKFLGGSDKNVFFNKDFLKKANIRNLSYEKLRDLAESLGIDERDPTVAAMLKELRSRTFDSHWIKRNDVPGPALTFDDHLEAAKTYALRLSSRMSKQKMMKDLNSAFRENKKDMSLALESYALQYIQDMQNINSSPNRFFSAAAEAMSFYKFSFDVSFLTQQLAQPIITTYPLMADYFRTGSLEATFIQSIPETIKFLYSRARKKASGLNLELVSNLNRLFKGGHLSPQITEFLSGQENPMLSAPRNIMNAQFRLSELYPRTHAAIIGWKAAKKQGLKGEDMYQFMRNFVYRTSGLYAKQNLPQFITSAGSMQEPLRFVYLFRHFQNGYMSLLNSTMPWRTGIIKGFPKYSRALGALIATAGLKGLPYAALALGLSKKEDVEAKVREIAEEAGVPPKVVDMLLYGLGGGVGLDMTMLLGAGDVVRGDVSEFVAGPLGGFARQFGMAYKYLEQGRPDIAIEYLSPDFIKSLIKAKRSATEGIRTLSGDKVYSPSQYEQILIGMGFMPLGAGKSYAAEEAVRKGKEYALEQTKKLGRRFTEAYLYKEGKDIARERKKVLQHDIETSRSASQVIAKQKRRIKEAMAKKRGIRTDIPGYQKERVRNIYRLFGSERRVK